VVSDTPARAPIMPIMSEPAGHGAAEQGTKILTTDGAPEAPIVLMAPRAVAVEETPPPPAAAAPATPVPAVIEPPVAPVPVEPKQPTKSSTAAAPKQTEKPAAPVALELTAPAPIMVEERPATTPAIRAPAPVPVAREPNRKPVSLFVSLKDGKLYARQGMEPLFDMPIAIAQPGQPLGTHVFTAMGAKDGGGLRWTVVSIASSSKRIAEPTFEKPRRSRDERTVKKIEEPAAPMPSAAATLDRIVLPPMAMERIAGLVMPGSSLIVSDNRLSDETSDSTEFIVTTR
jgi:hypothetical protein